MLAQKQESKGKIDIENKKEREGKNEANRKRAKTKKKKEKKEKRKVDVGKKKGSKGGPEKVGNRSKTMRWAHWNLQQQYQYLNDILNEQQNIEIPAAK